MVMSSVPSNVAAHATATSAPDHLVWFQHFKRLYTHSSGKIDENGYFRTFTPCISLGEEEAQRMKRGGGLHPARPYWWPPTKRPRATPGGLIAASVMNVSRREGVFPCLRMSPSFGGTLGIQRTSWRIPFPRHAKRLVLVLLSEVLECRTLRLESQNSAGLRMQPYPRALDHLWPGHLHGMGCLSALAMDSGVLLLCGTCVCVWVLR